MECRPPSPWCGVCTQTVLSPPLRPSLPLSGWLEVGKLISDSSPWKTGCSAASRLLSPAQHSVEGLLSEAASLLPHPPAALLPQDRPSRAPWLWEARGSTAPTLSSGKDPGAERVSTHSPQLKPGLGAGPYQPSISITWSSFCSAHEAVRGGPNPSLRARGCSKGPWGPGMGPGEQGEGRRGRGCPLPVWPTGSCITEIFIFGEAEWDFFSLKKKKKTQNIKLICLPGR